MLHHAHRLHHHVHHHSKKFLVKLAERHPFLTGALVLVGGVSVMKAFSKKESTTSGSAGA